MNSEAKVCVKLIYVENTCRNLHKYHNTSKAGPTLLWMMDQCGKIVQRIAQENGDSRKSYRWAMRIQDCTKHMMTTITMEDAHKEQDVPIEEAILYCTSIITQMLEDLTQVKQKAHLVNDLCAASYTLENLFGLGKKKIRREDEIREEAQIFVERLYSKINEM